MLLAFVSSIPTARLDRLKFRAPVSISRVSCFAQRLDFIFPSFWFPVLSCFSGLILVFESVNSNSRQQPIVRGGNLAKRLYVFFF